MNRSCFVVAALVIAPVACGTSVPSTSPESPSGSAAPATHRLTLSVHGAGRIENGIAADCRADCAMDVAPEARVALVAVPESGNTFAGWSGACNGAGNCSVVVDVDRAVTATFSAVPPSPAPPSPVPPSPVPPVPPAPPAPAAECDGLLPPPLSDPVVAALEGGADCIESVSDDGAGNFALGYERDNGFASFREWRFFTIAQGQAVALGADVPGEGAGMFSQPSGFTRFGASSLAFSSARLSWYSHEGVLASAVDVGPGAQDDFRFQSRAEADPSGGMVVVRSQAPAGAWVTEYERFDKSGGVETPWVSVDHGTLAVVGVGVALSGHVLVLGGSPDSFQNQDNRRARWLARDGTPLTGWFDVLGLPEFPAFDFLVDGSLVVRDATRGVGNIESRYQARFEDGKAAPSALPDWLAQRSTNRVFVIRAGKGYASWGTGGSCGGRLEVLAASGRSCGCIPVPHLGLGATIGRDGSLMVPWTELHPSRPGTCKYDLYPQLLK